MYNCHLNWDLSCLNFYEDMATQLIDIDRQIDLRKIRLNSGTEYFTIIVTMIR